ncbi:MAG: type IV pilus assembly protein PilM [Syntrophomonadaceae bacterium]|nr:type IV pilus assembly protein PilM [Syntrophomonadaceae bacterium]
MNLPGIGLDIGSRKIKIARVKKKRSGLEIISFASRETPRGVIEAGAIMDPYVLGEAIAELVNELGLKNRSVISAVAGPQVYTRIISMPRLTMKELRQAVKYEAAAFLPVPVEQAAMDIYPIREYQDREGSKIEMLYVAVRQSQVERLKTSCRLANLKLQSIELEPLALNRLFPTPKEVDFMAFLNLGAFRPYFSIHRGGVMLFNRNFSFAYSGYPAGAALPCQQAGFKQWRFPGTERVINEIVNEIDRSCQYFKLQHGKGPDKILITGGGARIPELDQAIANSLSCQVEVADLLSRVKFSRLPGEEILQELNCDFAVATGLALGGIGFW